MTGPIRRILIVGGGSAGWLAAAYVQRMLNRQNPGRVEVSLVESPELGIIGVGEATVPSLVNTLRFLGIEEADFMRRTHATYKQAIRFINWRESPAIEAGNYFYHPFDRPSLIDNVPAYLAIAGRLGKLRPEQLAYELSLQPWLSDANLAPKIQQSTLIGYAYHMDAVLMGRYLKEISMARGVVHIEDKIERVSRAPDGSIASLHTQAGRTLEADLYIDCSGFNSLLLQGVFEEPFLSYKDSLFCDRAVAMQVPTNPNDEILPYTKSTGMSAGWIWEIQLRERKGIGYVYSADFISDEAAERELRTYVGPRAEGINSRVLPMRVGRTQNFWVKNCVALGLSSGFIEPLESTGIYLIEIGIKVMLDNLSIDGVREACVRNYNQCMRRYFDEIRDFIVMHYCLTNREDTEFWRANKFNTRLSEALRENLEVWRGRYPSPFDDVNVGNFFTHISYLYILAGMGKLPLVDASYSGYADSRRIEQGWVNFARHREAVLSTALPHREYLLQTLGPLQKAMM